MPELQRNLPHLFVSAWAATEPYTAPGGGGREVPPLRERAAHSAELLRALNVALGSLRTGPHAEGVQADQQTNGFILEFRMPRGAEKFVQKLEDRRQQIELLSVSDRGGDGITAAVYVPARARDYFVRKIERYRDEVTQKDRPKNEALITRVDTIALGALQSVFTEDMRALPQLPEAVWWEIWLRRGEVQAFRDTAAANELRLSAELLTFPEREVLLAFGTQQAVGRCVVDSGAVAEVRIAKDTPALFLTLPNNEQREWTTEAAGRFVAPQADAVAVCVLDSGATREHALLEPALDAADVHKCDPNWPDGDSAVWHGHGTAMAGLSLHGDLYPVLVGTGPVLLTHRLEVVKMLAHDGQAHEPHLYGAITRECATRPEVVLPLRPRVHCMAVTSESGTNRGRPSCWSAALDQLAYGEDPFKRLFVVSTGNIRTGISARGYPALNDTEPAENPAQAWNALTVGAFTEKHTLVDPTFAGWNPIAPVGAIAPCSRTSVSWERKWPVKPDVVFEGGNHAASGNDVDRPDDLSLLTTYHRPLVRQFQAFGDTSAATSLGARFSAQILADRPDLWMETVRALVVHSAEWTPRMRAQLDAATSETQRLSVFRRCGYGVPNLSRALRSSYNDANIVAEDSLRPLRIDNGKVKTQNMNLYTLPWPVEHLAALAETTVQLRVTLSYFIEPNPGERGWKGRYRYASHGLRFGAETQPGKRAGLSRAHQPSGEARGRERCGCCDRKR